MQGFMKKKLNRVRVVVIMLVLSCTIGVFGCKMYSAWQRSGDFEMAGNEKKEQKLYHSELLSITSQYVDNQNTLNNEIEPIIMINNFIFEGQRVNGLKFFLIKFGLIILPLAFLIFLVMVKKELIEILRIKKFIENRWTSL
jgi:hypothetical protein